MGTHLATSAASVRSTFRATLQSMLQAPREWAAACRRSTAVFAVVAMQVASAHAHQDPACADAAYDAQGRRAAYDRGDYEHNQHWLTYARLRTHTEGLRREEIALPPDTRALRLIAVHRRVDIIAAFVQYPDGRSERLNDLLVRR